MNPLIIALIVVAVIVGLVLIFLIIGRLSAKSKKISSSVLKRFAKPHNSEKKTQEISEKPQAEEKKEETITFNFDDKPTKKQPQITSFEDFDEQDKEMLASSEVQEREEEPEIKRKSFEEIMRNRQKRIQEMEAAQPNISSFDDFDDDFEDFRAEHSVYSKYMKDADLIEEIKNASPQMRAIIFSNLFGRVKHDD